VTADSLWLHLTSKHGPPRAVQWDDAYAEDWHARDHDPELNNSGVVVDWEPHAAEDLSYDAGKVRMVLARFLDHLLPLDQDVPQ
jgi:hypothetical protein